MKAEYLRALAKMLRARESGDEALESNLLDELDGLWEELTDAQRNELNSTQLPINCRESSGWLVGDSYG